MYDGNYHGFVFFWAFTCLYVTHFKPAWFVSHFLEMENNIITSLEYVGVTAMHPEKEFCPFITDVSFPALRWLFIFAVLIKLRDDSVPQLRATCNRALHNALQRIAQLSLITFAVANHAIQRKLTCFTHFVLYGGKLDGSAVSSSTGVPSVAATKLAWRFA